MKQISKKNKDGFFSLEGYMNYAEIDINKDVALLILTAPRDIGKSTNVWKYIEKEIWEKYDYTKKVAYCRTTDIQMKGNYKAFEESFKGKYRIKGDIIQKIVYKPKRYKDKDSDTYFEEMVIDELACFEIGRFVNVKNEHNYRSQAGKETMEDYALFFWDEFNETEQQDSKLFAKFLNILSTIRRNNTPFLALVIGNKINSNNDLFVKFDLDTGADLKEMYEIIGLDWKPRDTKNDWKQIIDVGSLSKAIYIDIGSSTFNIKPKGTDLISELAKYDTNTDALYNKGSFLMRKQPNVLNKKCFINKKPVFMMTYNDYIFLYSKFGKEHNCICFEILAPEDVIKYNLPLIAFNTLGYLVQGSRKLNDDDEYKQLFQVWINLSRTSRLYYDSYEAKLEIDNMLSHSVRLYKLEAKDWF